MPLQILLIDDSPMMRKMVMRALRQTELELGPSSEASNGQEGLEELRRSAPDLVLCDWNMPVMDGLQFVSEARTSSSVPIIMLTTEGGAEKMTLAMEAGASGYLTKPFTSEKLESVILQTLKVSKS